MITVKDHSQGKAKNATNDTKKTKNRRESNYHVQCHTYHKNKNK